MRAPTKAPAPSLAPSRSVRARVRRFIIDHDLVRSGERVLVAVSGGPDSTCLLLTLAELRRSLGLTLAVAYFDHRLRGPRAAAREERFVRSLAERLGLPLQRGGADVRGYARQHRRSLEDAAREVRYRFLARAARAEQCDVVAVGHTRDDQAETVLIHLVRGSGLRGLAAMAPSARWPVGNRGDAPRLVRPLLCLSREETDACCREARIVPLRDPSNRSRAYLRNRIRHELLPLLRRYNPRVDDALVRLADSASADVEALERLAGEALVSEQVEDGIVRLSRRSLAALPEALQRHAVRLAVASAFGGLGDARALGERHVRAILRAIQGPTGAELDLPRRLHAEVTHRDIVLATRPTAAPPALPDGEVPLPVPGAAHVGSWRFQARLIGRTARNAARRTGPLVALLDAEACGDRLWLRRRRPGDRFQPLGLSRPKKLQDFFVDAHVSRRERDRVPLVCGNRGIAWVVGQRPAEWAKVTPTTRRVLRLRAFTCP